MKEAAIYDIIFQQYYFEKDLTMSTRNTTARILSAILVAASLAFSFASCGTPSAEPSDTTPNSTPAPEKPYDPGIDVLGFELSNHVTLGDYASLKIVNNVYCDDETLAENLKHYAQQEDCYFEVKDRPTKKGDVLNIAFKGSIEGVYFEGGTSASSKISLTENTGYIDGFDADLYGIMPGTTVKTNVTFPENYTAPLAGMDAVFEITVNYIYEYGFDDEKIVEMTLGTFKTLEEFSKYYREQIIMNNLKNYEASLRTKIVEELKKVAEIKELPNELVDYYYNDMVNYYKEYAESYKVSVETIYSYYGLTDEMLKEQAKTLAAEDVILHAVFVSEGLTLSQSEYRIKLIEYANNFNYPSADALEREYGEFYMKNAIRKDMCLEHLIDKLDIETDYDEYEHLLTKNEK